MFSLPCILWIVIQNFCRTLDLNILRLSLGTHSAQFYIRCLKSDRICIAAGMICTSYNFYCYPRCRIPLHFSSLILNQCCRLLASLLRFAHVLWLSVFSIWISDCSAQSHWSYQIILLNSSLSLVQNWVSHFLQSVLLRFDPTCLVLRHLKRKSVRCVFLCKCAWNRIFCPQTTK